MNNMLIIPGRNPGELYIRGIGAIMVESWDDGMIYDTVEIAPTSGTTLQASKEFVFFRDVQNKKETQTNMTISSQLPSGWELIVLDIGFFLFPWDHGQGQALDPDDAKNLLRYGYLQIILDNSFIAREGPVTSFPSGYGPWGTVNISHAGTAVEAALINNGLPSPASKPFLSIPIRITDRRTFQARLKYFTDVTLSNASMKVYATVYLAGLLKMPVT